MSAAVSKRDGSGSGGKADIAAGGRNDAFDPKRTQSTAAPWTKVQCASPGGDRFFLHCAMEKAAALMADKQNYIPNSAAARTVSRNNAEGLVSAAKRGASPRAIVRTT